MTKQVSLTVQPLNIYKIEILYDEGGNEIAIKLFTYTAEGAVGVVKTLKDQIFKHNCIFLGLEDLSLIS